MTSFANSLQQLAATSVSVSFFVGQGGAQGRLASLASLHTSESSQSAKNILSDRPGNYLKLS